MIPHQHHQHPAAGPDEDLALLSRRTLLRQPLLGMTALGLTSLLIGCGGDDDDQEGAAGDEPPAAPELDPDAPALAPEDRDAGEDEDPDD